MSDFFTGQAQECQKAQSKIEAKTDSVLGIGKLERTTLTLSITKEDKIRLQVYASRNGVTAANVIHFLIQTLPEE